MPWKSKKTAKRTYKKRAPRRKAKTTLRPRNNMNTRKFNVTAKWSADVHASTTEVLAYHISALSGVTGYKLTSNWSVWSRLYDQYRVAGCRVKLTPKFTQTELINLMVQQDPDSTQAPVPLAFGSARVYSAIDRDGVVNTTGRLQVEAYESSRLHRLTDVVNRSMKFKYPSGFWLDCQVQEYSNDILKNLGLFADIAIFADKLPAYNTFLDSTIVLWRIEIEYDMIFMGPNVNAAVLNTDGDVVLKSMDPVVNVDTTASSSSNINTMPTL